MFEYRRDRWIEHVHERRGVMARAESIIDHPFLGLVRRGGAIMELPVAELIAPGDLRLFGIGDCFPVEPPRQRDAGPPAAKSRSDPIGNGAPGLPRMALRADLRAGIEVTGKTSLDGNGRSTVRSRTACPGPDSWIRSLRRVNQPGCGHSKCSQAQSEDRRRLTRSHVRRTGAMIPDQRVSTRAIVQADPALRQPMSTSKLPISVRSSVTLLRETRLYRTRPQR